MGIWDRLRLDRAKSKIKQEVAIRMDAIKKATLSGDVEKLEQLFDDFDKPSDFHSAVGGLAMAFEGRMRLSKESPGSDGSIFEIEKHQNYCDSFFNDLPYMRAWVFAMVGQKVGYSRAKLAELMPVIHELTGTEQRWIWIAIAYYTVDIVESRFGPAECTKERFWKQWQANETSKVEAMINNLSQEEVNHYAAL